MEAKAASRILRLHSQNSRDPFHILDNPRNLKQARSTFRKLALLLHPDKCGKLPICEEAFKVVNNAYRRIESEYGAGDEAPAVEDIFNFNETTTSAAADADVEPAVSPTDVRAARCNWANGKARSGVGEDGPRFADDRADFPFTAGTASCGVSTEGYRAPSRDEWVRRWDKENLGPVSMVSWPESPSPTDAAPPPSDSLSLSPLPAPPPPSLDSPRIK